MNDEQAKALGLRAVATGFNLEPGCRVRYEGRLYTVLSCDDGEVLLNNGGRYNTEAEASEVWPDFRERPSMGHLLGRVREVWADPLMGISVTDVQTSSITRLIDPVWNMRAGPGRTRSEPMGPLHRMTMAQHRTEVEAMVAALEAAPGRARHESENA